LAIGIGKPIFAPCGFSSPVAPASSARILSKSYSTLGYGVAVLDDFNDFTIRNQTRQTSQQLRTTHRFFQIDFAETTTPCVISFTAKNSMASCTWRRGLVFVRQSLSRNFITTLM